MQDWTRIRGQAIADVRLGWRASVEDLAIATLVTLPFTVALMILVGWMSPLPSRWLLVLTVIVQVAATFWNAGWRARSAPEAQVAQAGQAVD